MRLKLDVFICVLLDSLHAMQEEFGDIAHILTLLIFF